MATASLALLAQTASFALNASVIVASASYAQNAVTASYVPQAVFATSSLSASYSTSGSYCLSSSYARNASTASALTPNITLSGSTVVKGTVDFSGATGFDTFELLGTNGVDILVGYSAGSGISFSGNLVSVVSSPSASVAQTASLAITSSYSRQSQTASYLAGTASAALSASYLNPNISLSGSTKFLGTIDFSAVNGFDTFEMVGTNGSDILVGYTAGNGISFGGNSISVVSAPTASLANTASYARLAQTSSYSLSSSNAVSASLLVGVSSSMVYWDHTHNGDLHFYDNRPGVAQDLLKFVADNNGQVNYYQLKGVSNVGGLILQTSNDGRIVEGSATPLQLSYLSGVTASIQNQLNGKQNVSLTSSHLTGNADLPFVVSDGNSSTSFSHQCHQRF